MQQSLAYSVGRQLRTIPGSMTYAVVLSLLFFQFIFLPAVNADVRLAVRLNMLKQPATTAIPLLYFAAVGVALGGLRVWIAKQTIVAWWDALGHLILILAACTLAVLFALAIFNPAADCMLEHCTTFSVLKDFAFKYILLTVAYSAFIAYSAIPNRVWYLNGLVFMELGILFWVYTIYFSQALESARRAAAWYFYSQSGRC